MEGRAFVEGEFIDTVIGIPGSRTEIVMLHTPDGGTRLELSNFVRPDPTPGPGEVKIKVAACGICGSDIHVRHDSFPYWPPVILGHEFAGVIEGGTQDPDRRWTIRCMRRPI